MDLALAGKAVIVTGGANNIGRGIALGFGAEGSRALLVNCAGGNIDRLFLEKPREEWEREVAINFWGFINCSRAVLDQMVEQRSGAVVSISSDAGRMGEWRETVYSGTKAGIIAMSKSLAREVGSKGIRF